MHLSDNHSYDDGDDTNGGDDGGYDDDDGGGDDGGYDYDDGGGDDVDAADNDIARPHIASRAFLSVCGAVWCVYVECNHRNLLPTKQTKKCCSTRGGGGADDDDGNKNALFASSKKRNFAQPDGGGE